MIGGSCGSSGSGTVSPDGGSFGAGSPGCSSEAGGSSGFRRPTGRVSFGQSTESVMSFVGKGAVLAAKAASTQSPGVNERGSDVVDTKDGVYVSLIDGIASFAPSPLSINPPP